MRSRITTAITAAGILLATTIAGISLWSSIGTRNEVNQRDKRDQSQAIPKLEIVTNPGSNSSIIPIGPEMYTAIHAKNHGKSEALVTRLVFSDYKISKTPMREKRYGASPPREVILEERHRDNNGDFVVVLAPPATIRGGEYQSFHLYLVIPKQHGDTYTGTVTLHYDDGKTVTVGDVALDVLEEQPER